VSTSLKRIVWILSLCDPILDCWDGRLTREMQFVKFLGERFPQVEVRDCSPEGKNWTSEYSVHYYLHGI